MTPTPELNKALAKAREDIHNPPLDSENKHFNNKFSSLKAIVASVVPVLAKHGIAVIQDLQTINDGVACYTHLCHVSGEEKILGPLVMKATKQDPQGYASASTYARRYHLQAVGCVVGDVDDDGNAASVPPMKISPYDEKQAIPMPKEQAEKLIELLDAANPLTGEGCDAFGEAWIDDMDDETRAAQQLGFKPWFDEAYKGSVTAARKKFNQVLAVYKAGRNGINTEEAA